MQRNKRIPGPLIACVRSFVSCVRCVCAYVQCKWMVKHIHGPNSEVWYDMHFISLSLPTTTRCVILHMRYSCSVFTCVHPKDRIHSNYSESVWLLKCLPKFWLDSHSAFQVVPPLRRSPLGLPKKMALVTNDFNLWIIGLNDLFKLIKWREKVRQSKGERVSENETCKTGRLECKNNQILLISIRRVFDSNRCQVLSGLDLYSTIYKWTNGNLIARHAFVAFANNATKSPYAISECSNRCSETNVDKFKLNVVVWLFEIQDPFNTL